MLFIVGHNTDIFFYTASCRNKRKKLFFNSAFLYFCSIVT